MNTASHVKAADYGNVVYFSAYGDDIDACRAAVIHAAHDHVFASVGKSAEVSVGLSGGHGGAFVTGAVATVRFL